MKKLLWFFSDQRGCGTYRVRFPAYFLQDTQYADNEFTSHQDVHLKGGLHFDLLTEAPDFDAMIFQRAIGGPWHKAMRECQDAGAAAVIELDDDLFEVPRHNPAHATWGRRDMQKALRAQLDAADHVIVSTTPLALRVAEELGWGGAHWRERISVCANHLHPEFWGDDVLAPVTPFATDGVVLGWQGSTTHEADFNVAAGALCTVLDRFPQVTLRLFGALPRVIQQRVPESRRQLVKGVEYEAYPGTLKFLAFDIGIAPVTPCRFNESKSNLKWLEYSALRVPCVASSVYPYAQSIRHGETGFLASTEAEWVEYLSLLVADVNARRRMGQAAYDQVWAEYSASAQGPGWQRAFDALPARVSA